MTLEEVLNNLRENDYSDESIEAFDEFLDQFDSLEDFKERYERDRWFWNDYQYLGDIDYIYDFYSAKNN